MLDFLTFYILFLLVYVSFLLPPQIVITSQLLLILVLYR